MLVVAADKYPTLDEHGRNPGPTFGIEIRREAQRTERIRNIGCAGWGVGMDLFHAARKPEGCIQQQGWTEGVRYRQWR